MYSLTSGTTTEMTHKNSFSMRPIMLIVISTHNTLDMKPYILILERKLAIKTHMHEYTFLPSEV